MLEANSSQAMHPPTQGPKPPRVSVVRAEDDVRAAVAKAMELSGWKDFIARGSRVLLKVNLGWDLFLPGSVTSPLVTEGVATVLKDHVGDIIVADADQVLANVDKAFDVSGMGRMCERAGLRWMNLSKDEFHEINNPGALVLKKLSLPKILAEVEIVSVPVMKTHAKTVMSGAIKNLWGCLPLSRHELHLVVNSALADLLRALKPKFSVVDATICLEGNGPKSGKPREVGLVMASADPVAIDSVQAKVMGFEPLSIPHLKLCSEMGLGTEDLSKIEIVGEDIGSMNLDFRRARHNIVSQMETIFRGSAAEWLIFRTPVFRACCFSAQIWYLLWYHVGPGKRLKNGVVYGTRYGQQWR